MTELNIEQFSPKKAELIQLAESYKTLEIQGIDDKEGYETVDTARKDLKKTRVEITKTGKSLREEAVAFQKKVIATEKELVSLIEPIEAELQQKQDKIDEMRIIEERKALLPDRQEKLKSIGVEVAEEFILLMDSGAFLTFFNEKHSEKLAADQAKLEQERAKLDEENRKMEQQKQIERARQEAAQKAQEEAARAAELVAKQAEADKLAAVAAAEARAAKEKQDLIAAQEREKQVAANAMAKAEREKAEQEAQKKIDQAKLERQKKYKEFLVENGYNKETAEQFNCIDDGTSIKLYKLVAIFKK